MTARVPNSLAPIEDVEDVEDVGTVTGPRSVRVVVETGANEQRMLVGLHLETSARHNLRETVRLAVEFRAGNGTQSLTVALLPIIVSGMSDFSR